MTTTAPPGHGTTAALLRRSSRARVLQLFLLTAVLALIAAVSVTIGSRDVGIADILAALSGSTDGFGPPPSPSASPAPCSRWPREPRSPSPAR